MTADNTACGESVNERTIVSFFQKKPTAEYCTDVFSNKSKARCGRVFYESPSFRGQMRTIQDIGKMLSDALKIASALSLLSKHLK